MFITKIRKKINYKCLNENYKNLTNVQIKELILIFCHGMFLLIYRTGICHSLIDTDPDSRIRIRINE